MTSLCVAFIFNTSVWLMVFLSFVKAVHPVPHYATAPRTKDQRVSEKSQAPVYYEKYLHCNNQICMDSEDYPEDDILKVMRNTKNVQGFFGVILNSTLIDSSLASRFGISGTPKHLCEAQPNLTFRPRVLRNINSIWKFVVNVEGYQQHFAAEICMTYDSHSRATAESHCYDFGYACRQNYAEVYFLTYENGIIDFDKFMVPTTCNCVCDA